MMHVAMRDIAMRETERQRDRETERQRDRETERHDFVSMRDVSTFCIFAAIKEDVFKKCCQVRLDLTLGTFSINLQMSKITIIKLNKLKNMPRHNKTAT